MIFFFFYPKKPIKVVKIKALIKSIKKAPTIGTIRKALWEGPKRSVTDCILATAVGVAPKPKPQCPAQSTAAS